MDISVCQDNLQHKVVPDADEMRFICILLLMFAFYKQAAVRVSNAMPEVIDHCSLRIRQMYLPDPFDSILKATGPELRASWHRSAIPKMRSVFIRGKSKIFHFSVSWRESRSI